MSLVIRLVYGNKVSTNHRQGEYIFDKTVSVYHKKTVYPTQTKLMYPIKQNNDASS